MTLECIAEQTPRRIASSPAAESARDAVDATSSGFAARARRLAQPAGKHWPAGAQSSMRVAASNASLAPEERAAKPAGRSARRGWTPLPSSGIPAHISSGECEGHLHRRTARRSMRVGTRGAWLQRRCQARWRLRIGQHHSEAFKPQRKRQPRRHHHLAGSCSSHGRKDQASRQWATTRLTNAGSIHSFQLRT